MQQKGSLPSRLPRAEPRKCRCVGPPQSPAPPGPVPSVPLTPRVPSALTGKGQQPLPSERPGTEPSLCHRWEPCLTPFVALLCLGLHTDGFCPRHHPAPLPPAPRPRGLSGRTRGYSLENSGRSHDGAAGSRPSPTLPCTPGSRRALAFLGPSGAPQVS